ncbi:hypothetical protein E8E78_06625 [Pseudomonas sp. BN505]|nr:hypothetical protein [Pseudomonas sp. BN605]MDH4856276.1 hypothetical protein [Pseudomonas sp. BN505]
MPVTSLRKACVRPPEVAKIKSKIKIKIKSWAGGQLRIYQAVLGPRRAMRDNGDHFRSPP